MREIKEISSKLICGKRACTAHTLLQVKHAHRAVWIDATPNEIILMKESVAMFNVIKKLLDIECDLIGIGMSMVAQEMYEIVKRIERK